MENKSERGGDDEKEDRRIWNSKQASKPRVVNEYGTPKRGDALVAT